jgi:hypothetical protein
MAACQLERKTAKRLERKTAKRPHSHAELIPATRLQVLANACMWLPFDALLVRFFFVLVTYQARYGFRTTHNPKNPKQARHVAECGIQTQ